MSTTVATEKYFYLNLDSYRYIFRVVKAHETLLFIKPTVSKTKTKTQNVTKQFESFDSRENAS